MYLKFIFKIVNKQLKKIQKFGLKNNFDFQKMARFEFANLGWIPITQYFFHSGRQYSVALFGNFTIHYSSSFWNLMLFSSPFGYSLEFCIKSLNLHTNCIKCLKVQKVIFFFPHEKVFWFLNIFSALGICMIRDSNTAMLGQYFKKKRPLVELILTCSSGFGISFVSFIVSRFMKWVIAKKTDKKAIFPMIDIIFFLFKDLGLEIWLTVIGYSIIWTIFCW